MRFRLLYLFASVLIIVVDGTTISAQSVTWKMTNLKSDVPALAVAPNGAVFAYTQGRIWHSWDRGDHWSDTGTFYLQGSPTALAIDNTGEIIASSSYEMFRSTNMGAEWDTVTYSISPNWVLFAEDHSFYVGNYNGISQVANAATSWHGVVNIPWNNEYAMAIAPNKDLYVSGDSGLFRSSDGGLSWWHTKMPHVRSRVLAVDSSGTVYVGTDSGLVYYTSNAGATFKHSSLGLNRVITSMLVTRSGVIYLSGEAIWRSEDHGATWIVSTNGLTPPYSSHLALSADGYLYSGWLSGIARSTVPVSLSTTQKEITR
jgi:photosystem II stability/assembly factor-like uncharacterized protein